MAQRWGSDPLQRALRAISVVCFLGMLFVVALDPRRDGNWPLSALLIGGVLVQLGYDVALRIPGILDRREQRDGKRDD